MRISVIASVALIVFSLISCIRCEGKRGLKIRKGCQLGRTGGGCLFKGRKEFERSNEQGYNAILAFEWRSRIIVGNADDVSMTCRTCDWFDYCHTPWSWFNNDTHSVESMLRNPKHRRHLVTSYREPIPDTIYPNDPNEWRSQVTNIRIPPVSRPVEKFSCENMIYRYYYDDDYGAAHPFYIRGSLKIIRQNVTIKLPCSGHVAERSFNLSKLVEIHLIRGKDMHRKWDGPFTLNSSDYDLIDGVKINSVHMEKPFRREVKDGTPLYRKYVQVGSGKLRLGCITPNDPVFTVRWFEKWSNRSVPAAQSFLSLNSTCQWFVDVTIPDSTGELNVKCRASDVYDRTKSVRFRIIVQSEAPFAGPSFVDDTLQIETDTYESNDDAVVLDCRLKTGRRDSTVRWYEMIPYDGPIKTIHSPLRAPFIESHHSYYSHEWAKKPSAVIPENTTQFNTSAEVWLDLGEDSKTFRWGCDAFNRYGETPLKIFIINLKKGDRPATRKAPTTRDSGRVNTTEGNEMWNKSVVAYSVGGVMAATFIIFVVVVISRLFCRLPPNKSASADIQQTLYRNRRRVIVRQVSYESVDYEDDDSIGGGGGMNRSESMIPVTVPDVFFDDDEPADERRRVFENEYVLPDSPYEIDRAEISIVKRIGAGAFGVVSKAFSLTHGVVAVKQLKDNANERDLVEFIKEIEIMKHIGSHDHVVQMKGCVTRNGPILIVVEYACHGNLQDFLMKRLLNQMSAPSSPASDDVFIFPEREQVRYEPVLADGETSAADDDVHMTTLVTDGGRRERVVSDGQVPTTSSTAAATSSATLSSFHYIPMNESSASGTGFVPTEVDQQFSRFPPAQLTDFALQIADGMAYLHSRQILHRDLAARNVLVMKGYQLKIADFGRSRELRYYETETQEVVPVRWMAPEVLTTGMRFYSRKSDIWSFGIVLWEIFSHGALPYATMENPTDLINMLDAGYRLSAPDQCPLEISGLMAECWRKETRSRPPMKDLRERLEQIMKRVEAAERVPLHETQV